MLCNQGPSSRKCCKQYMDWSMAKEETVSVLADQMISMASMLCLASSASVTCHRLRAGQHLVVEGTEAIVCEGTEAIVCKGTEAI
eukprot:scaffold23653_cov21-Tisochrysis_lutea.AAC.4